MEHADKMITPSQHQIHMSFPGRCCSGMLLLNIACMLSIARMGAATNATTVAIFTMSRIDVR